MKKKHTDERGMRTEGQMRSARKLKQNRRRKGESEFKPDSNFVKSAVEDYLKKGGKIRKQEIEETYNEFMSAPISALVDKEFEDQQNRHSATAGFFPTINFTNNFQGRF